MEFVLLPLALVLLFYFILLRPVLQRQREHRRDISELEIGDEVLTTGGFYAIVRAIDPREDGPMEIKLEAAPGVVLRATPLAIDRVTRHAGGAEASAGRDVDGAGA